MRRIIALVMTLVLLWAIAVPAGALPEFNDQDYLVNDYIQAVYDQYEMHYNSGAFCSWEQYYQKDARFAYVMADEAYENHSGLKKVFIDIAEGLTDDTYLLDPERTNVDIEVQYCEVALLSLIKTLEQNLLSYEAQNSADETMTTMDYMVEGAGAVAFFVGLAEGDAVVQGLQTLIGSVNGSIGILDKCRNAVASEEDWALLAQMWIVYDNVDRILAAIEDYPLSQSDETMDYLKRAAANLRIGVKYSLLVNLDNFDKLLGKSVEELGSFVFSDVLKAVTEQELQSIAPGIQATDWANLRLLSKAASALGMLSGMVNAGVFLADCVAGASDILLRYHEIRAMAAARRAVLYQAQLLREEIDGFEDTALIQEFGEYLHCLLYITARGEYCVYQLLTKDANLLTLTVDDEEREWYVPAMIQLNNEYNNVSTLFPNISLYLRDEGSFTAESFAEVIETVQDTIFYHEYSDEQKEYCRGEFFRIAGKKALVLMYYATEDSLLTPGYYTGLWVENEDGTISRLTNTVFGETAATENTYAAVFIRENQDTLYLNPYFRSTQNKLDISHNRYDRIGDALEQAYELYSEVPFVSMGDGMIRHDDSKAKYLVNQEAVSEQDFYSLQDELNGSNIVVDICPVSSEGQEPTGKTFEKLLAQASNMDSSGDRQAVAKGSYQQVLKQHPENHSYELPVNGTKKTFTTPTVYALYDIDKDGVSELIVRERSTRYYIYAFDGMEAVLCGEYYWSYGDCLREYDGNGLAVHDGGMGSLHIEYVTRYELSGSTLREAELLYNGEEEPMEKLTQCLERYSPITDFYPITEFASREMSS